MPPCREHVQRRRWHPTPVFLPGKSHEQRSLVGYSPWGREESDTTERLHFYFSLSCIGEGNGNPLQCSCLENSRDRGAWWAAFYGVTQSRTRLKQLSSSSSSREHVQSASPGHNFQDGGMKKALRLTNPSEPGSLKLSNCKGPRNGTILLHLYFLCYSIQRMFRVFVIIIN